jgi:iron complex outermembrane recepter protein
MPQTVGDASMGDGVMNGYFKRADAVRVFAGRPADRHCLRRGLLGASLLVLSAIAVPAPVQAQSATQSVTFNIPAQSAGDALEAYARQTGIQVMFPYEGLRDVRSRPLIGVYDTKRALAILLERTGLKIVRHTKNSIILRASTRVSSSTASGPSVTAPSRFAERAQATRNGGAAVQQSDVSAPNPALPKTSPAESGDDKKQEGAEIVVTGTLIRGTKASVGSQLITIDRKEIERAGFGTVPEILHSLTQNFKGGISEDSQSAESRTTNLSGGTSVNLRGLGAGSTLTLVNGRRLAAGGTGGSFVDISSIPASLIERVEVLADGASATYGSDAIGGVVNIILRKDFDGAETALRFGTVTEGGSQEYRASQIFGKSWGAGHALLAYEYYSRERLGYRERSFTASRDLRPFGGSDFRADFSVPGNILHPVTRLPVFAIPSGQDGTSLTASQLLPGKINLYNENANRLLFYDQERHSFLFTGSHEISDHFEIFAEGRYINRKYVRESAFSEERRTLTVPRSNPFFVDPFGGRSSIRIQYHGFEDFGEFAIRNGTSKSLNGVFGFKVALWDDWQVKAHSSYSSDNLVFNGGQIDTVALNAALADPNRATAFNPFGDGSYQQNPDTIRKIVVNGVSKFDSYVWTGSIVADGSLIQLRAGDVKVALGASYDKYSFDTFSDNRLQGTSMFDFGRNVKAVFGEILVPLFGEKNARPGLKSLSFSASIRHESYDDVGKTTNPKFGVLWSPFEGLSVRGNYGTSFRAPDLRELDTTNNASGVFSVVDPLAPTGRIPALILFGNNSRLSNETAKIWTAGFDFSPSAISGLKADLTYYNVRFENRIVNANAAGLAILNQEARFGAAITRSPSRTQIEAACAGGGAFSDLGSGPCPTVTVGAIIDFRPVNAAITKTDGLDFNIRYAIKTENTGNFDFGVGGTYILNFDEAFDPTAPVANLLDTVGNQVALRLRNSVAWAITEGPTISIFMNYTDKYRDNLSIPARKINSWTTFDLSLTYNTRDKLKNFGLNNVKLSATVRNLFGKDPPFVDNGRGFDFENASSLGSLVSFNFTKSW